MKSNKNGVKLLALVAVFVMVAAAFVIIPDVNDATGEAEESAIDLETKYSNAINNGTLGNVLESTSTGITGYVSKITDNDLSAAINGTWSEAGKDKAYQYALVFTVDVDKDKYITFVGSDGVVKSKNFNDGKMTLLKYINEKNKNSPLVYAVSDTVQTTMPTTGLNTITIDVELAKTVDPTKDAPFTDGGNVSLDANYIFSKSWTITKKTTLTMNGYDIVDMRDVEDGVRSILVKGTSFTVNGDDDSKIISAYTAINGVDNSEIVPPEITINGGTYTGDYTIIIGAPNESKDAPGKCHGSLSVSDAKIVATSGAGIWASYGGIETLEITNCKFSG